MSTEFYANDRERQEQEAALHRFVAEQRGEPVPLSGKPRTKRQKRTARDRKRLRAAVAFLAPTSR